jgi:hypothetical protein
MACRDFVKNSLPKWQSLSPKVLDGNAEKELAGEIDNEGAKIVSGDGVEVVSNDDSDISWTRVSSSDREDDSEDVGHSSQEEDPSWGTKNHTEEKTSWWPSPPTDNEDINKQPPQPSKTLTSPAEKGWQTPLRHIKSTISLIVEATSAPFTHAPEVPVSPVKSTTLRDRTSSLQHRPTHERRRSYHRAPLVAMESVQHPAPRPLMRRSSHADISTLCRDWADFGPANRTVNYKSQTPQSQRSRRNSRTKSVVDLFTPMN